MLNPKHRRRAITSDTRAAGVTLRGRLVLVAGWPGENARAHLAHRCDTVLGHLRWLLVELGRPVLGVGQRTKKADTAEADQELHPQRRVQDQHEVADEGEEHAAAEHLQRMLSAKDRRTEALPLEALPVARHETRDEEGDDDKMN